MTALDVELRAAFRCSKAAARHDGIDWQLTFDEFYEWWTQEDRWSRRGRTAGRISMARLDARGPFALHNLVEIERADLIRSWRHPHARPVRTPARDFPSAAAAGLHHGIRRHTAARWARSGRDGWSFIEA
jgi:hypothetical protein